MAQYTKVTSRVAFGTCTTVIQGEEAVFEHSEVVRLHPS